MNEIKIKRDVTITMTTEDTRFEYEVSTHTLCLFDTTDGNKLMAQVSLSGNDLGNLHDFIEVILKESQEPTDMHDYMTRPM